MHRSGTTLVTEILQSCGVFMGAVLEENHESLLFQEIDRDVLDALGAGWRTVEYLPAVDALARCATQLAPRVVARLERDMPRRYWGRSLRRPRRWGWKDPRTSLLLPVWHAVFPDATIVHVVRDGRSVARSLYERDVETLGRADLFTEADLKSRFVADVALWEAYERRIRSMTPRFARQVAVRYETLLDSPADAIARVVEALGLDRPRRIDAIVRSIDRGRDRRPWPAWTDGLGTDSALRRELGY